jgi:hypothetical protein
MAAWGVLVWLAVPCVWAQKDLVALTYKYRSGEKYRVSTSTYRNLTTISQEYRNATYGEIAYDVYQTVTEDKDDLYRTTSTIELTRFTQNGENLTYKMYKTFENDVLYYAFDRFGVVDSSSVRYENTGNLKKASFDSGLGLIQNVLVPLPTYPLKVGDKWKVSDYYSFHTIFDVIGRQYHMDRPSVKGDYVLASVDQGVATIEMSVELSGHGDVEGEGPVLTADYAIAIHGSFQMLVSEGRLTGGSITAQIAAIGAMGKEEVEFSGSQTTSFHIEKLR